MDVRMGNSPFYSGWMVQYTPSTGNYAEAFLNAAHTSDRFIGVADYRSLFYHVRHIDVRHIRPALL
jgi:hypothetical protein